MVSKIRQYCFAWLILFAFSTFVFADQTDEFVRQRMKEKNIPGAVIAVVKNGKVIKQKGYGLASIEFNAPVTTETVFEIGSVSKQMTAAAIMLLVEDGKVNLDEKISKYLPNTPESWKNVTVRNLLTHTSGIRSYTAIGGFALNERLNRDTFIKQLAPQSPDFETGTNYTYSNSGYNLLGYIIESVSGKNYWDFMRERIFTPLKMTKTADRDPKYIIPNRATGYEFEDGKLVGRDYDLTDVFSAGAIVSTIGDLVKWDAALRNDTLLKKSSKLQMQTPLTFNNGKNYPYGFGFRLSEIRRHKIVAHSGQTAGFGANISRYVDDDITVIALTNLGESGMGTLLANGIAKIFIPAISLKNLKPQPEPEAKISTLFANALRARLVNNLDANLFATELVKSLSNERSKINNQRIALFGTAKSLVFVGSETLNGATIYRYKAETPKRIFLWRFAINNDGKISEMTLEEEE